MFYLIESQTQFEEFREKGYDEVFIEPILFNDNLHPSLNGVSLLYIKSLQKGEKGYLLCLNHNDALALNRDEVDEWLKTLKVIFVRDKKAFLYHYPLQNIYDISFQKKLEEIPSKVKTFFYQKYPHNLKINKIIPLTKHYEICEEIFEQLYEDLKNYEYEKHSFWNKKAALVFFYIEKNGIKIDEDIFFKTLNTNYGDFSITNGKVFTQYHLYNLTRRPSNSFNGVNFAALDKKNGCRAAIIPENDYLLEIDISAYHPTLAIILSGMEINTYNLYSQLANECNMTTQNIKKSVFTQLYGGIQEKYLHIEYFKKLDEYIKRMWKKFNEDGKIICPISNYEYNKNKMENINPNKLFNYILQNYETANNVEIIWDVVKLLLKKKTKIILYTYDSILLDVKEEENVVEDVKNIFRKKKLHIKENRGINYDFH